MSGFRQYPPQTGSYSIKATGADWHSHDTVRLEISVGYPYHEGNKMKATLEWADARFKRVVVLVNDTLQRNNYIFENGLLEKEAFARAQQEGSEWIARYSGWLAAARAEIYRWEDWRHHPDYGHELQLACRIYNKNKEFQLAVNNAIEETWHRRTGNHPAYTQNRKGLFFSLSREYLIEETGVFSLIFKTIPGVSAYPGSFHEMWNMFDGQDDPDIPSGLGNVDCLTIKFRRNRPELPIAA